MNSASIQNPVLLWGAVMVQEKVRQIGVMTVNSGIVAVMLQEKMKMGPVKQ